MEFLKGNLSKISRYLVLVSVILLTLVFFIPIWNISLTAPQYPEGLSMNIWIYNITGGTEYDVKNINLLNHYIGMKEISKDSIPELKFMPYVLAYTILGALITFLFPKRIMVILGIVNLFLVGIVGLGDFWKWEYDYGHNLNPEAPIIVPGMAYQPPLLFCKDLLNINACSVPHAGGYSLFAVIAILVFIIWYERRLELKNNP